VRRAISGVVPVSTGRLGATAGGGAVAGIVEAARGAVGDGVAGDVATTGALCEGSCSCVA